MESFSEYKLFLTVQKETWLGKINVNCCGCLMMLNSWTLMIKEKVWAQNILLIPVVLLYGVLAVSQTL
jgi:hypothetical protein